MSESQVKLLNLMRFWLFGTFVIVWAAITTYIGLFTKRGCGGGRTRRGAPTPKRGVRALRDTLAAHQAHGSVCG